MDDCRLPFQCDKALCQDCAQAHAVYALEGYETKSSRMVQKWSDDCEETGESEATKVTDEELGKEKQIAREAQGPEEQMNVHIEAEDIRTKTETESETMIQKGQQENRRRQTLKD
jgi:hypothetical protein